MHSQKSNLRSFFYSGGMILSRWDEYHFLVFIRDRDKGFIERVAMFSPMLSINGTVREAQSVIWHAGFIWTTFCSRDISIFLRFTH
jgi:hypothetical protein